ncbi:hypothetical protein M513_06353 [Trichuris suis]|uniref:Putative rRNA methyltransferase n=1 Tax=Trichuris suis TaxID=68888 RepID=A0A085M651_9BILA|nr:hypothetical protein M513_06353 [Trichuris suis]
MSDPLLNANLLYHLREKNYFSVLQLLRGKEDLLDDSFNRLLLGIALLMTDNADEATAEFEKIPGYSNVHLGAKMGLIQALRTRDKLDEQRMAALQASLDAIKAKPSQMELYSFATVLFFTGQYEEADKALNQLLTNFPHAPEALILKGWLELAQSSNTKKALQYVEQGASMNNFRSDPNVLLARAKCAELSGKADDALEQLGKICITSESFLPAMVERAKLFLGKRNWEAFAAEAQSCKEMSVNDYCSLNLWILAQITYYGSYAEASKCMTQLSNGAVQVGLRSAGFMCDVILVYIRSSGRDPHVLEGARRLVEGIQKKDGNNGDVKCLLGELYRMKRSYTNSLKEYQAASLLQKSSLPSLSGIAHCFITQRQMNDGEAQMELITAVDSGWQQSAEGSFLLCLMSIQRSKDLTSLDAALDDLNAKFQKHIENINSTRDLQKQLSDHICSTALSILASLLEYIPGLLAVFFLKACFHILRDDVDKATEELRECLAKDAENSSVYLLLAEISLRQGNYNEAKSTLEAAVSYDFNVRHQPNYHLIRARLAAALNDTKEAIAILNNAVKLHCLNSPKGEVNYCSNTVRITYLAGAAEQSFFEYESLESIKFKIRLELAKLLQLNGDLAEAEELLTDLSQQHDEDQEGQIILSQCDLLLRRNDVNKALNLLSEISSDKWYYVQARKVMADIYLTYRKDKRQYIACFKEMMHSSPTPEIFIAAGEAYARILEMEKAIEMYETALRKNPKDFALTRTIGQTYVRSHNYLKASSSRQTTISLLTIPLQAVSYFEAALKKSGHDLIRYDLALLLLKLGKTDKCERYLRQYFDAFKSQDEKKSSDLKLAAKFYELYSRLYLEMNQHELSIETLQKAKNLYLELAKSERSVRGEDNVEHLLQACRLSQSIGNFYEGQHAYSKAAVYYTEGLKYDAKNIKLMLNLAHIYLITNNLEECHQQCRAVMKIDKNNDEATLLLADLMYQKNEMSTALDLFKSLLERNPNQYHALLRVMEFSLRMGTTDDVESLFTSALTRNRRAMTDSGFNYCKGFYEWKTGNSSGALSFFSKARKDAQWGEQATYNMIEILLNPDNKVIGSDAWEKDQLQEADVSLENHSTGNVHLKMAEMYLKELRFKQKNDFKYKLMENLLLLASKDKTAPEKVLNNLLRMGGDDASQDESNVGVILGLARVYRILKQNAKAKVCLKKTLNAPWNFENANWLEQCWLLLADIYIGQSKNEHALEVLKTCVKYNASCIKAMDYMGTISQKLQLWKNATTDYEKAWKLSRQRDADIGYKLAYCYLKAKMYVAAIDTCHAVLRLCPDYPKNNSAPLGIDATKQTTELSNPSYSSFGDQVIVLNCEKSLVNWRSLFFIFTLLKVRFSFKEMGKKKIGKQRRDKYYALAKEAGYRSRAAFKLIQLNQKFKFLEQSVCLVDLCAAPGGWMQVASQFMPVSKLLIGVDLVPIRPLPNAITIQGDITTDSCKVAVKKQLQTWNADCVLHDGSPNVGKSWHHDAFQQAQLTLQALKLAVDILRPGGWFVTKLFRSKDHPALVEVFRKLFTKVQVTKPQASRQESAEVFVVCQGFQPKNIKTVSLQYKKVFEDLSLEPEKTKINALYPEKQKRKAEGYADGAVTLFNKVNALDFVTSDDYLEVLGSANELILDDARLLAHPDTDDEVKTLCKDVKVLGRKEIRQLMKWRRQMRQHLKSLQEKPEPAKEGPEEPDEETVIDNQVASAVEDERKDAKRKRRKSMKEKRRYKRKLEYEMVVPGDEPVTAEEQNLFSIHRVVTQAKKPKRIDAVTDDSDADDLSDEDGFDQEEKSQWYDKIKSIVDEATKEDDVKVVTKRWFGDEDTEDIEMENEDFEIDRLMGKSRKGKRKDVSESAEQTEASDDLEKNSETQQGAEGMDAAYLHMSSLNLTSTESGMVDDSGDSIWEMENGNTSAAGKGSQCEWDGQILRLRLTDGRKKEAKHLSAEELALGQLWIHSSKTRRDIVDAGFNRYANNDENLPDWFVADEKKHYRANLPVTKEAVELYKRRQMEINARPIKKVVEAKMRKKRRALKRMERVRKKAESLLDNEGMTDVEKRRELKKLYKECKEKRKKVTYIVAKKGLVGKRVRRPAGVKGRFKVVDPRMKKDTRSVKARESRRLKRRKQKRR